MGGTERRVVSVLFADLVGFTTLSERLDPEDVAVLQQEYFSRAREAVASQGGQVEKFIGDAVVAVFGVSHSRGDEPSRAIRAGLAVIEAVAAVELALALEPGTLRVRVGVNTGEVVVVRASAAPDDWRLAGDVINTAARLQTAAEPGTVLVGADTAFGAAPDFVLDRVGDIALKGKAASTPGWRVRAARAVSSRASALHGWHAELVGRDAELAHLEAAHRDVPERGATMLVLAPPGAGKTRLVDEFGARSLARGLAVWATKVREGGPIYAPVADLLYRALGDRLSGVDVPGALLERLGSVSPRAELCVEHTLALLSGQRLTAEPAELWTSWAAMLDAHPGDAPVWMIEDVDLAAADVRAFIRHAAGHVDRRGRLIVLTARPGTLAPLDDEPFGPVEVLDLGPLDGAARGAVVDRFVGTGVVPADVVAMLSESSRGNPLFIEELLRSWAQSGALRRDDDGRWVFDASAGSLHVPSTVWALYLGQLDDLPAAPRGVVEAGSVPGTTFPSRALPVLGVSAAADALDFLTAFGLLAGPHAHQLDGAAYTYRHGLLRDAAYAALPRARRADLHQRFAEWLVKDGEPDHVAELVGRHFARAHDELPALAGGASKAELAGQAALWLERAAADALGCSPHHAAEVFGLAQDLVAAEGPAWARLQLGIAESRRRSGRLTAAMDAFARVPASAPEVVDAALGYEEALYASRMPRSEWGEPGQALLQRALSSEVEPARAVRLLAALARTEIYGGNAERGAATAQTAIRRAREADDAAATAHALLAVRSAQSAPEHLADRLSTVADAVAAARRAGDRECELEALRLQFVDLLEAGDLAAADHVQREAEEAIVGLARPLYLWYPPMWRAMRALLAGDLDAAAELIDRFHREASRWHYQDVEMVHAVQALELHSARGDATPALELVTNMTEQLPERFAPVRAVCLARLGRFEEAAEQLSVTVVPDDQSRSYVLALATEVAAAVGDTERLTVLRRELEAWAGHHVVLGSGAVCLGSASHYLGIAERALGDVGAAVRHGEDAVRMNEVLAAGPVAERASAELARSQTLLDQRAVGAVEV